MPKGLTQTAEYIEVWAHTDTGLRLVKYYRFVGRNHGDYFCRLPEKAAAGAPWGLHKAVWEWSRGLKVPEGYCVHHINEDPSDNRPENLKCMKITEHNAWHHKVRAMLDEFLRYNRQLKLFTEV